MPNHESGGRIVAMMAIGLVLLLIGLALATNFRGLTEKHVDISLKWSFPVERRPPFRWISMRNYEARRRVGMFIDRIIGAVFALFGLSTLGTGIAFAIGRLL
jgi:hypothetical protein